jgi:hypothetical protein
VANLARVDTAIIIVKKVTKTIIKQPMMQIEKNKILAEYLNIDFDKLCFAEKCQWHNNWNNLMKVANKLKEDTEDRNNDYPFSFVKHHLSFDIDDFYNTCLNFIKTMEKYDKQRNKT